MVVVIVLDALDIQDLFHRLMELDVNKKLAQLLDNTSMQEEYVTHANQDTALAH